MVLWARRVATAVIFSAQVALGGETEGQLASINELAILE